MLRGLYYYDGRRVQLLSGDGVPDTGIKDVGIWIVESDGNRVVGCYMASNDLIVKYFDGVLVCFAISRDKGYLFLESQGEVQNVAPNLAPGLWIGRVSGNKILDPRRLRGDELSRVSNGERLWS